MANALYDAGRNAFLTGAINWTTADIRVVLVDTADYVVDLALHDNLDDVPAIARTATSAASLATKTATAGVADADDVTFTAVTGDQSEALVLYLHTGTETTSTLIAYIDTATNLPVTPTGGDITVSWSDGANKIFKL